VKEVKPKTENVDPNVEKVPKATKDGAKKPTKAGMKKLMSRTAIIISNVKRSGF